MKINITELEAIMIRDALNELGHGVSEMEEVEVGNSGYHSLELRALETANHKIVEVLENERHKKSS